MIDHVTVVNGSFRLFPIENIVPQSNTIQDLSRVNTAREGILVARSRVPPHFYANELLGSLCLEALTSA
jgi:hypothetical protein